MTTYNLTAYGSTGLGYGRSVGYSFTADTSNTAHIVAQDDDAILNDWSTGNYHGTTTTGIYNGDTGSTALSSEISWLTDGEMITSGVWYELEYTDPTTYQVETVEAFLIWDDTNNDWGGYANSYVFTTAPLLDGVTYTVTMVDNNAGVTWDVLICFATGTLVETKNGDVPIETLSAGDLVMTLDHGLQPLRWIGSRTVHATGDHAPICINKGALGNNRNLLVSPQHRMLLRNAQADLYFDNNEVLIPAKFLLNGTTIAQKTGGDITYFHMLFDAHEIVFAEGIPSESLHPNSNSLRGVTANSRREIFTLFPELETDPDAYSPNARISLRSFEAFAFLQTVSGYTLAKQKTPHPIAMASGAHRGVPTRPSHARKM